MTRFDEVLSETVRRVEAAPFATDLAAVTVIRDLRGRVRLVLELHPGRAIPDADRQLLAQNLANALGPYWGGQIWRQGERQDATYRALETQINSQRQLWLAAPTVYGLTWYRLDRTFSKSAWLSHSAQPPWDLNDPANPAIVTFYSFKGGVGRTTALAAVALLLARAGRRVIVVDLDLEAPGLGTLLLTGIAPPDLGVVDYLLEVELTGRAPANLAPDYVVIQTDRTLIGEGQGIIVLPAGRIDAAFLEKIARLDFEKLVTQHDSPVVTLLEQLRTTYTPDFILLDVRSGLHDLGGFSLNGLSHLDLLFGLDTTQSWDGLNIVLPLLGARAQRREVALVHTMVTPTRYDPDANQRFRRRAFDLFRDAYYRDDEDMPDLATEDAPYRIPIPYQDQLLNLSDLTGVADALTASQGPYQRLARLIGTYLARETV
jgi:hypothetical protein